VHPAAAEFPLLVGEELDELLADIKANGLRHSIVFDAEGLILDDCPRVAGLVVAPSISGLC
jgi:hypothetical protein